MFSGKPKQQRAVSISASQKCQAVTTGTCRGKVLLLTLHSLRFTFQTQP